MLTEYSLRQIQRILRTSGASRQMESSFDHVKQAIEVLF